ncbi:photosystem II protein [Leptolyngbya cf. ectocarpi LEGE 11479]|uniref:Photosystem II protein n=1 Tax=Leptolyngbya cf. ectocarpi LEGE 11479 TaxID=1828722 RepID=A0A929FCT6_LEPEC|nr:photosystem II protein [Leptolyngbya ectocarpi]MBE9070344.1 photosystem II protein [Leptolyngbya cf. ectocarpi LEGE 11479]
MSQKYVSRKTAPLQYTLRNLNSEAGRVAPGWGTAPLMAALLVALLIFMLIILQLYNGTIVLEGFNSN